MKKAVVGIIALILIGIGVFTVSASEQPVQSVQPEKPATVEQKPEPQLEAPEIARLVNEYRTLNGLPALIVIPQLEASAQEKCLDMRANKYLEHVSPTNGINGPEIARKHYPGIGTRGENLQMNATADEVKVLDSWKGSPSHNAGMLDTRYSHTGVAVCAFDPAWTRAGDGKYIVQHFSD